MRCPTLTELPPPPTGKTGWPWTEETSPPQWGVVTSRSGSDPTECPRITVITPSYNQAEFLEETIRSVLLQGYPNIEYIIVDDGSTDHSVEIIRKYERYLAWWTHQENRGQSHALNQGFDRATGHIHAYLNSDDVYEPGALYACVEAFKKGHPFIVGQVRYIQEGLESWPVTQATGNSLADWLVPCPISQPGCFWAAALHREAGRFREDLHYFMDYEFWLRFRVIKNIKPLFIERPIALYRLHPKSKTVAQNAAFTLEGESIRERYIRLLTRGQRVSLWAGLRRRKARRRGSKAVSLLKKGEYRSAMKHLLSAIVVWPPVLIDLSGFLQAIRELSARKQERRAVPEVWPEWDV